METTSPTAPEDETEVSGDTQRDPRAAEVAGWLLEGRFFTVDVAGVITMWSPPAAETFGWSRRDIVRSSFIETLIAPPERDAQTEPLAALLRADADASGYRAEVDAVDITGAHMRVAFAAVPIHVGVGYEFNELLQEIASSSRSAQSLAKLKARDESVLALIDDALCGRHAAVGETEDAHRLTGALVVFRTIGERTAPPAAGRGEDGAPREELIDALRGADEARAELQAAHVRMDEAVAEAERLRADAKRLEEELARTNERSAADAEQLRTQLAEAREQAQAEAERLRSELAGARDQAHADAERLRTETEERLAAADGVAERIKADLATAREEAERAERELAEARRELAAAQVDLERRGGELEAAQARDDALRSELHAISTEAAEARALVERTGAELETARAELEHARERGDGAAAELREEVARLGAELTRARAEVSAQPAAAAEPDEAFTAAVRQAEEARARIDRLTAELASAREAAEHGERALVAAQRETAQRSGELEAARAWGEAMQTELSTLSEQAAEARVAGERARADLERTAAELDAARHDKDSALAGSREESDRLTGELGRLRTELAQAHAELDSTRAVAAEVAQLKAELGQAHAQLTAEREANEGAAKATQAKLAAMAADLEQARAELAGVRESAAAQRAPAPVVRIAEDTPMPGIEKRRASAYLDSLLAAPHVSDVAAAESAPREPVSLDALTAMVAEVEAKNKYAEGHSHRVADYAVALAKELGLEQERIDALRQAALLHDVGKIEIDDAILTKDAPLNLEEQDEVARHSQIGRELLAAAGEPQLAEWVRHVHERFDGGGYPLGLAGGDIPVESRILHAVDALDHMTRPRAHRRDRPLSEALSELAFCAGTRLDPDIATRLTDLVESGRLKVATGAAGRKGLSLRRH